MLKIKLKTDPRISKYIADNVYVEGRKIDLDMYKPMRLAYDLNVKELLVLAGRQIGKSVYLASKASTKSIIKPNNRILYVSPLESQAKTWSKTKLGPIIDGSPNIKAFFKRTGNNVFFKENILGSYIEITYASLASAEPARVRGKSADDLFIDETQDIVPDALPVIRETTTSSLNPTITFAGTAKSEENLTGVLYSQASRIEYVYICEHCNHYNIIDYDNIGENGLICSKCKKPLSQDKSKWMVVNHNKNNDLISIRIPQVIIPFHQTPAKWRDIWKKRLTYSPDKFKQEVLGIPTGSGSRFLSEKDLIELCDSNREFLDKPIDKLHNLYHSLFMGIDWSGEGVEDKSRTVWLLMGHRRVTGNIDVIAGGIIPPGNPIAALEEIKKQILTFKPNVIAADAGMGAMQNAMIISFIKKHLSARTTFLQVRYISSEKGYSYNKDTGILHIDKTSAIDTIMLALKRALPFPLLKPLISHKSALHEKSIQIRWPKYEQSMPYFRDILNEFSQQTKAGKKIWTHSPDAPDDALHALTFGFFGYTYAYTGKVKFY